MNTHSHNIPQWDRGGSIHASPNQAVGENRDEMSKVMLPILSRDHKIIATRSRWLRENPHARYIYVSQKARVISEAQVDLPSLGNSRNQKLHDYQSRASARQGCTALYPRYRMIDAVQYPVLGAQNNLSRSQF
ncbi:hypothetical protein FVEG_16192 [Fusarium verticillioides 7600]|uniref:Uncharacterized protein n=1 Tax=Gibberella moniliformis (strain M3125 / FGSC 7600) TaxID=334819 RepID=W7M9Y3_GIBM7|nr:hypothetical protein FVEG_16192 [Fusarium verticillioides 7600]EWG47831.1 hypothetical protein FVEG_16192 [Fusarium verticillioides 7600]